MLSRQKALIRLTNGLQGRDEFSDILSTNANSIKLAGSAFSSLAVRRVTRWATIFVPISFFARLLAERLDCSCHEIHPLPPTSDAFAGPQPEHSVVAFELVCRLNRDICQRFVKDS